MVHGVKELSAPVGMMGPGDRMVVLGMRVPVQTPTPVDVAVVRPPVDADAGDDREQDPCIENTGVEPVPRPTWVQPCPRKETRKQGHQATKTSRREVAPGAVGRMRSSSTEGNGADIVTTQPTIAPRVGL